jgi:uncharacterized protein YjbI with pentapeptide repeats
VRDADYEQIRAGVQDWNAYANAQRQREAAWHANLRGALLYGGHLDDADLFRANLTEANLTAATLASANLSRADLTRAYLTDANLANATLVSARLIGAYLDGVNLGGAFLPRAELFGAVLIGANLTDADLTGVELTGANLHGAHLNGADLSGAHLSGADLTFATLRDANLKSAHLPGAHLPGATLSGADLDAANLSSVHLSGADLSGANLTGANLTGANLTGANLTGVNLHGATLGDTVLADVDVAELCSAEGLRHAGPSYIDIRTLVRSHTHPGIQRFLVDCGIPDDLAFFLLYDIQAQNQGDLIRMMNSTFISYGGPDEAFAERIYKALKPTVQVFFFPQSAKWGERVETETYRGIQKHDRVLLVCSKDSLNRKGVIQEIREALARESREDGVYLLPVRLDDYLFAEDGWTKEQPELCQRLRDRVIGDFRAARENQAAFDDAIHRLKQELIKDRPGE